MDDANIALSRAADVIEPLQDAGGNDTTPAQQHQPTAPGKLAVDMFVGFIGLNHGAQVARLVAKGLEFIRQVNVGVAKCQVKIGGQVKVEGVAVVLGQIGDEITAVIRLPHRTHLPWPHHAAPANPRHFPLQTAIDGVGAGGVGIGQNRLA